MKRSLGLFLVVLFILTSGFETVSAQFDIKIPKIKKPKIEQPKTDEPKTNDGSSTTNNSGSNQNTTNKSSKTVGFMPKPYPTNVPVLLKNSFNIKPATRNLYWKTPNEQNHTSWVPRVSFDVFYDKSETVRYTIEWLDTKGALWFSEALDGTRSDPTGDAIDTKATDTSGTYGFRLLNTKTKEMIFQGKFKVGKILLNPNEPRTKNQAMFYVENDGNLPIGYVGFDYNTSWDYDPQPSVYLWFKGDLNQEDFEARLFHNNQQITSTDDGGSIGTGGGGTFIEERNDGNCFQQTEVCRYTLWGFTWKNFRVESYNFDATAAKTYSRQDPNAIYTKDKPGEYTVKIFYKGQQVRETKFTVQPNGWLAPNAYASQVPMDRYKAIVPVKIMGTLDKWTPTAWKTDAFYGNPLTGFAAP